MSCRPKNIDINVQSEAPKLVVFTHIIPNNIMLVALSKSFSVLDGNTTEDYTNLLVSGATVQIKFGNKTFEFYEVTSGLYASVEKAFQVNENYELLAYLGNDTIRSTTKMLPKINFKSLTPIITKNDTDTTIAIDFSFNDIPNTDNWYLLNVYKKLSDTTKKDAVNYFKNGTNNLTKTFLISDKEFSGTYHNKLEIKKLYHNDSIVVTLSNINEDYYTFLTKRTETGNVFTALNIEPIEYPSNIKNGYGFFNTHFPDIQFFDLGKY